MNTITIDGVEYVKKSDQIKNSNIKIVILQRGWVMIGRWSQDGDMCTLEDTRVIRRWGTTDGLGQLAIHGKQEETKLEKTGNVTFHMLTTIAIIDVDDKLWDSELN